MLMKMLLKGFIALTVITGVLFIVGQFLPPTEWGPLFWPFGLFVPVGVVGSYISFEILKKLERKGTRVAGEQDGPYEN